MNEPVQAKLTWTRHPVIPMPTREQLLAIVDRLGPEKGREEIARLHRMREEAIVNEKRDPLRHGFEPETFAKLRELLADHDEVLVMGANREGKTEALSKIAVEDQVGNPNKLWAMFEQSERASIHKQQKGVHRMLPPEWRDVGKVGADINVKYTKANGFSGMGYILPNGSQGMFFNYKQDVKDFEGYELDGAWFSELVPLEFIESMSFRVGQGRRMVLLIDFTPVTGYTAVVAKYVAGARIVESRPIAPELHEMLRPDQVHVKGCPPGQMPYVMQCLNPRAAVLFFHWGMNPYGAHREVLARLKGKPKAQWLIRCFGWVDKPLGAALPRYGQIHRITRAAFDAIAKKGVTRYCVIDPAGTKNWFIKWYAVTPQGWRIVYREWPDFHRYGPWAIPPDKGDKQDWRPGEAQRIEAGRGIDAYKIHMLELEGWRWDEKQESWDGSKSEIIERTLIDPRLGGAGIPGQAEGTSILDLLENETLTQSGRLKVPRRVVEEAPGRHVQHGLMELQKAMEWDEKAPLDALNNAPQWYVVDDLVQTDLCYREYTGLGTEKDALKDIIDPDRYFIESGYGHVEPEMFRNRRQTYY